MDMLISALGNEQMQDVARRLGPAKCPPRPPRIAGVLSVPWQGIQRGGARWTLPLNPEQEGGVLPCSRAQRGADPYARTAISSCTCSSSQLATLSLLWTSAVSRRTTIMSMHPSALTSHVCRCGSMLVRNDLCPARMEWYVGDLVHYSGCPT